MPGLQYLDISLGSLDNSYPLDLSDRCLNPVVTQNALVSISLSFPGCFRVLEGSGLSTWAPNLKNLLLDDQSDPLSITHLSSLPSSLKTLTCRPRGATLISLSISDFVSLLPISLEKLEVAPLNLLKPDFQIPVVKWPPNLVSISVYGVPLPYMVDHGPPNLEVLEAIVSSSVTEDRLSVGRIPKSMRTLSINIYGHPSWYFDVPLPPNMGKLWVNLALPIRPVPMHFFPQSLRDCVYMEVMIQDFLQDPTTKQLPNIDKLVITPRLMIKPELLPSSLKELEIDPRSNFLLTSFPSQLTSLNFHLGSDVEFSALPRSLASLELRMDPGKHVPSMSASQWRELPPNLTKLSLDLWTLDSVLCLRAIPSLELKSIELCVSPTTTMGYTPAPQFSVTQCERHAAILEDVLLASFLPSDLNRFSLRLKHVNCAWQRWVASLAQYQPSLDVLMVEIPIFTRECLPPPVDFLTPLPLHLRQLLVPLDERTPVALDFLSSLPRSLTNLHITLPHRKIFQPQHHAQFTDDHFTNLPPKLTYFVFEHLQVSEATAKLTTQVISKLPPCITVFPFGDLLEDLDWGQAWTRHLDSTDWLGFPPPQ
jgi:hypothetical protein